MALYAILNERGKPIAYHHRKDIVNEYLKGSKNENYCLVKVKHPKRVEGTSEYADLYLTKVGNFYVPSRYYDSASILIEDELSNYYNLVDIVTRDLEFMSDLTDKDKKALERTLQFYQSRIYDIKEEQIDENTLRRMDDMMQEYSNICYTK